MRRIRRLVAVMVLALPAISGWAQFAIKSNLAGWATTTTNLGIEVGLSKHSTLQLLGYLNPWDFPKERHFKIWMAQPEYRYWFCEKFNGHFIGIHAMGGQYNAKGINFPLKALMWGNSYERNPNFPDTDHSGGWPNIQGPNKGRHVEGWYIGGGITYGYQWMLSKHWNFEASIGVGYVYSPLKYYGRCAQCVDKRKINYVGPTNAQLSFLYIF